MGKKEYFELRRLLKNARAICEINGQNYSAQHLETAYQAMVSQRELFRGKEKQTKNKD